MPEQYEEIFNKFVKERLGGLAGNMLLKMYMDKAGISSLSSLEQKDLIKFSDYFIYEVFKNHVSREEIDSIRLQLNLYFCFQKANEKISKMVNTDIILHPLKLNIEPKSSFDVILNSLTKDVTALTINITGYIKGTFLFFIFKQSALDLANIMIKSMLDQTPEGEEIDDMKESAIKEFLNIMIPTFLGTISNTLGKEIRYTFKKHKLTDTAMQIGESLAYVNQVENGVDKVKKIISTEIELDIQTKKIQGICFFMLENEESHISSTLKSSGIKKGNILMDIDIDEIYLEPGLGIKGQITALMDHLFPNRGEDMVNHAMSSVNISGFSHLSIGVKSKFIIKLASFTQNEYSERVVKFLKKKLGGILSVSVGKITLGPVKDPLKKVDKEILERMLREGSE